MLSPEPITEGRLIGYARVSRADQIIDMQLNAIIKYGVAVKDIYQEKVSGVANKRPRFDLCLEQLKAGDTLVVWKLDRVGRSLIDLCHLADDFNKRKINLISITESIDTNTAMGSFFFHIMASMAQLERDLIVERTKAGIVAAKARGTFRTRPIAFEQEDYEKAISYAKSHPTASRREVADAVGMKIPHVTKHWDKIQNSTPWPWGDNTVKLNLEKN